MIALQIISYVIQSQDFSIIENNQLTDDYFVGYEEPIQFIRDHYNKWGNVPDKATFLSNFSDENGNPTIELVEVTESEDYLVNTIREEHLYYQSVPVVQQIGKLLKRDANEAVEYMLNAIKELQPNYGIGGTDIIQNGQKRLEAYRDRRDNQDNWFFTTGFEELDEIIHGIQRVEEFLVIVARVNQGKSWVLEKIMTHIWEIGFNVGYISPEMGELSIGFRFDTLFKNWSNKDLMWGNKDLDEAEYEKYIEELKTHKNKFVVSTPEDFNRKITISKLRNYVNQYKLDALAIDGITYLSDERGKRGDTKTIALTNISEDLMGLSIELGIPILVVVQANRSGVTDRDNDDTPELESIRDSDGISHNASKVIAIKQNNDSTLVMQVKKQRNGKVMSKVNYRWSPNIGEFIFINSDDGTSKKEEEPKKERTKKKEVNTKEDVF